MPLFKNGPRAAFTTEASIEDTDFEEPVTVFEATGVRAGFVTEEDYPGSNKHISMYRAQKVYEADLDVEKDLRRIATLYHKMRDMMQEEWAATLRRARHLPEDA